MREVSGINQSTAQARHVTANLTPSDGKVHPQIQLLRCSSVTLSLVFFQTMFVVVEQRAEISKRVEFIFILFY